MRCVDLDNLTFEDVLRNPEEACSLLQSHISYELNKQNRSLRALSKLKAPVHKYGKIEDMLNLLEYDNQRRR